MKRLLKIFLWLIAFIVVFLVSFFFYGSSASMKKSKYFTVKTYNAMAQEPKDTLSVMTYNIGYMSGMTNNLSVPTEEFYVQNMNKSIDLIGSLETDIIGFQEIDYDSDRSYRIQQLDRLALACNYGFAYQSINWDKRYVPFPYWPPSNHFGKMLSGQSVLSKYPLTNDNTKVLSKPPNNPAYYNAFYIDRLVQDVDVVVGDRTIKVLNLHLEAYDQETRIQQALVVKGLFDTWSKQMPVLLIGDFNSQTPWEDSNNEAMKIIFSCEGIASAIPDSIYQMSPGNYYTYSSEQPDRMIDYILYNQRFIKRIDAEIVGSAGQISDHLPVRMTFTLNE